MDRVRQQEVAGPLMAKVSATRVLTITTLTMCSILAGAFALGLSHNPTRRDPARQAAASTPTDPAQAVAADHPPSTATDTPPEPSPTPSPDEPTYPPLPPEEGGPFGSRMTTGSREVALTFDDGPDPRYTPQALALLREYDVKATFCLVGTNVTQYPELVREIVEDGHTLCNHSWSHDIGLGARAESTIWTDLYLTNEAIRDAVPGARIAYYRQPGGNWTSSVVAVARDLGMTPLHWTVDPQDWTLPGAGSIAATVTADTLPGDIVLLHDAGGNREGTVQALRTILPNLARRFYLDALPTRSSEPS
ncbi:hypothetical protein GCM10027290_56250 [Micromonospora sonneratiae]